MSLTAARRANVIDGLGGNDQIDGEGGNDTLNGGDGDDNILGGSGRDTYLFDVADGSIDTILGFDRNRDKIDLSDLDAIEGNAGHDAFTNIGSAAFSGAAGELRVFRQGNHVQIQGDVDGDGIADLLIVVQGATSLGSADLVLG